MGFSSDPTSPLQFLKDLWFGSFLTWVRGIIGTVLIAAAGMSAYKIVPVLLHRSELRDAASQDAKQFLVKGEARVIRVMRKKAIELEFQEAGANPNTFKVASATTEYGTTCTISYDFVHMVDLYGFYKVPLTIEAQVTQIAAEPKPTAPDTVVEREKDDD